MAAGDLADEPLDLSLDIALCEPPPLVRLAQGEPVPTYLPERYSQPWCDMLVEMGFCGAVAATYGLNVADVWSCLDWLPPNQVHLLDSPQGWGIVADWIASELGAQRDVFLVPALH